MDGGPSLSMKKKHRRADAFCVQEEAGSSLSAAWMDSIACFR